MPYQKETGLFLTQSVNCYGRVANMASQKQVEEPWMFRKETEYPCKQEVGSFDTALWQMTPIQAAFVCSKACDIFAKDAFSVASQHSSALFLRSAGSAWQELKGRYLWISELRLEDLKRVTFHFWALQEDPTSQRMTLFSSFLRVWPDCRQVSYFHVCRGKIHQSQLVPGSPRLLDRVLVLTHVLNGKSPHHARKRKEAGRMPY